MIELEEVKKARKILGEQVNRNLDLAGKGNKYFGKLCEATGMLDVLISYLKKWEKSLKGGVKNE